jgi:hypothetical protein
VRLLVVRQSWQVGEIAEEYYFTSESVLRGRRRLNKKLSVGEAVGIESLAGGKYGSVVSRGMAAAKGVESLFCVLSQSQKHFL